MNLLKPILSGVLESLQYFLSFKMCRNEANNHVFKLFFLKHSQIFIKIFFNVYLNLLRPLPKNSRNGSM